MSTLLIAVLAVVLIVLVAGSAMLLAQVRRLRLVEPQFSALSPLEVPEDAKERLAPGLELLLSLGFALPVAQRVVAQRLAGQPVEQHLLTLTHPKVPAAAFLSTAVVPDGPRQWSIHFVSRTRDGQKLLTRNRASITGPLPLRDVRTNDVWLPDWPAVRRRGPRRPARVRRAIAPGPLATGAIAPAGSPRRTPAPIACAPLPSPGP